MKLAMIADAAGLKQPGEVRTRSLNVVLLIAGRLIANGANVHANGATDRQWSYCIANGANAR